MLRIVKVALAASVALWGTLGALGNILDWKATTTSVAAVTSMSTFADGATSWRATTNPAVVIAAAMFIVLFKMASALLCLSGSWRMWTCRRADAARFSRAKALALAGCAVAVFGLFCGWIVVGEGWFELWRSDALREPAGGSAFRYGGFIALIALMVAARDDELPT